MRVSRGSRPLRHDAEQRAAAERRRLERDLHDGAQSRLVSIGLALRHVQRQLPPASSGARELDAAVAELARAIDDLRGLVRGVRPTGLCEGLCRALRDLASRSHLPVDLDVTSERFEDRIETAAYFVASEALANVAKHARPSRVTIRAARRDGNLVVAIRDDGVGGAQASDGSGLAGMTERVVTLGGSLDVDSPPGQGTLVRAALPLGTGTNEGRVVAPMNTEPSPPRFVHPC